MRRVLAVVAVCAPLTISAHDPSAVGGAPEMSCEARAAAVLTVAKYRAGCSDSRIIALRREATALARCVLAESAADQ